MGTYQLSSPRVKTPKKNFIYFSPLGVFYTTFFYNKYIFTDILKIKIKHRFFLLFQHSCLVQVKSIHRLNLERLNLELLNLERLNPEWTQPRMDPTLNGPNPKWTQPRMDSTPEWTQLRRDSTPKGLNPEGTQPRMDSTSNSNSKLYSSIFVFLYLLSLPVNITFQD